MVLSWWAILTGCLENSSELAVSPANFTRWWTFFYNRFVLQDSGRRSSPRFLLCQFSRFMCIYSIIRLITPVNDTEVLDEALRQLHWGHAWLLSFMYIFASVCQKPAHHRTYHRIQINHRLSLHITLNCHLICFFEHYYGYWTCMLTWNASVNKCCCRFLLLYINYCWMICHNYWLLVKYSIGSQNPPVENYLSVRPLLKDYLSKVQLRSFVK